MIARLSDSLDVRRRRLAVMLTRRNERYRRFPASFQQQSLWFLEQLDPESPAYHVSLAWDYAEPRDRAVLLRALAALAGRHPTLRTTPAVDQVSYTVVQCVHPDMPLTLGHTDLSGLTAAEAQREAAAFGRRHSTVPFDLESGPLLRAHLLDLPGGAQRLLLTMHHMVADGWSLHILTRDFEEFYAAFSAGREPQLAPPACHYHDWASWQRDQGDEGWAEHLAFYRKHLAGAPASIDLPTDRPRPPRPTHEAGCHEWTVSRRTAAALHEHAQKSGTTLYAVLLTALATVLHEWSGQDRVVIGTPVANRTHPALFDTVGYFVNTAVIPVDFRGAQTPETLLQRVHALALSVLDYQSLPFDKLVEDLAPPRSLAAHPVFQVMLALQNTPDAWATEQHRQPAGAAKFDLTFNAVESPDGLHLECVYSAELFDPATVERLCGEFTQTLRELCAGPGAPGSPARRGADHSPGEDT
ncbi:MAG TPA: condensation domain-containing protein [Actinocrinis sp.]|nr:condensation domain-containing protein [Actinocrinis sp.]